MMSGRQYKWTVEVGDDISHLPRHAKRLRIRRLGTIHVCTVGSAIDVDGRLGYTEVSQDT